MKLNEIEWNNFTALEEVAIFGVTPIIAMLKALDGGTEPALTLNEKAALMVDNPDLSWGKWVGVPGIPGLEITPWGPIKAKRNFVKRFKELFPEEKF